MKKHIIGTFALLAGAALLGSAAHATELYSANANIAFQFRVGNTVMPAGEYRIEQGFGSEVAMLVNVNTGRRIQMLRIDALQQPGKLRLIFENTPQGAVLRQIR